MPKVGLPDIVKVKLYVNEFSSEFSSTPDNKLFCKRCLCIAKFDKTHNVESHHKTIKHYLTQSDTSTLGSSQTFLSSTNPTFKEVLTKAFLSANIPLVKLQHPAIRDLFLKMNKTVPSVPSCRNFWKKIKCY